MTTRRTTIWRGLAAAATVGGALALSACGQNHSLGASHPGAAASVSADKASAAAGAKNYANNPTVKADETDTLNAAIACEEKVKANPATKAGRLVISDCMATGQQKAQFKACKTAALAGERVGMTHPVQTFANGLTSCYTVFVLKRPVPPGMPLPAGVTAPPWAASSAASTTPSPTASH